MKLIAYEFRINDEKNTKIANALPIKEILDNMLSLPLAQRFDKSNSIRLASVTHKNGYSLCKFTKRRDDGPGKGNLNGDTEDIVLNKNEFFAEESCALICHGSNTMIVQFSMHGPRAFQISEYLSIFAFDNKLVTDFFTIIPIFDAKMKDKIMKAAYIKQIDAVINYDKTHTTKKTSVNGVDLAANCDELRISMRVNGKNNFLSLESAKQKIREFMKKDNVSGLKANVKFDEEGKLQLCDLEKHKLQNEVKIKKNAGHRYDINDINKSLEDSYNQWRADKRISDIKDD